MTNRRGFLGTMFGAAVAGPSLARSAASSLAQQGLASAGAMGSKNYATGVYAGSQILGGTVNYGDTLRSHLVELTTNRAKLKREQAAEMADMIDVEELGALRSVSPRHKAHMMIERRVERNLRQREGYLQRELRQWMEREGA